MATGTLSPDPWLTVLDANGNPVSGAKIYTYVAGTTTLVATYTDVSLMVANTNPIIADSAGRYVAFLSPGASYKFVVQNADGSSLRTQDNISATPATSSNIDISGVAGENITAGETVYLSDGSGGKTAGQWYAADSTNGYSSTLCEIGVAPATIASAASGTIRLGGQATGLTGLTLGTTYYVSTAGALTSTAPANSRRIGVADSTSTLVLQPKDPSTLTTAGQVSFPSAQNPSTDANTLDDYEEGVWTPVIGGSGGTSGQTYATQVGLYVKTGKMVTVWFNVLFSAKGTITGSVQIQGLPFTVENTASYRPSCTISLWTTATAITWASGFATENTNAILLTVTTAAATVPVNIATADLTNASLFIGSMSYRATA